jgi:hypothetical protein
LCLTFSVNAQKAVTIIGKVVTNDDVESIYVLNITQNKHTVTNIKGVFTIRVKLNDTLTISGIKYIPKTVVINQTVIDKKLLIINLEEKINELDEVVVGKILTGDLNSDIDNSNLKREINFYDLGIPGYTGKLKTQSERRLYEATSGGGIIALNPILNAISGRTKMLKERIRLEAITVCLNQIKSEYSEALFNVYELNEDLQTDFFYYCSDDPNFKTICDSKNALKTLEFLIEKIEMYKENLKIITED